VWVHAGTCSGLLTDGHPVGFPIFGGSNGHGLLYPTTVTVTENPLPQTCGGQSLFHVNGVTLTGGTPFGPGNGGFANPTAPPGLGLNAQPPYTVAFLAGPGPNVTTWYNQSNQCDDV
jgi:hypothetical protein